MSELTKLLEGVKVESKTLGEVIKLEKGKQLNKEMLSVNGTYPAYNGGISYSGFTEKYNYDENKTIISQGGASAGFVNFIKTKFYANAHCYVVLPHQDKVYNRYIYHILKLNQSKLTEKQFGAGIPALKTTDIVNIPILIPCPDNPQKSLKIQEEIVRILDRLSEETNQLTAALQKELQIHQKRYDFYREELFKFEGKEVEWKSLGEVSKVLRGRRLTKSQLTSEGYPVYHGGLEPLGFYHEFNRPSESVMIINVGASAGNVGYSSNDFWSSDGCYCLKQIENLNTKYLFYFLLSQEFYLKSKVRYAGIPTLDSAIIEKIKIPIPCPRDLQKSLEIQKEIVQLLDQFDEATITIAAQLKKEIALRNKQYQYYRDRLLSFQSLQTEVEAIQ